MAKMSDYLSNELESRSLELAKLSAMDPDDRIARIVWERVQDELESQDSMEFGMQFCISNIARFVEKNFRENDYTLSTISECKSLATKLGWSFDKVLETDQSDKIFINYIKEVVSQYTDTRQNHCENAQCMLAMNLNYMLLQDLSYLIKKNPSAAKNLQDAYESTVQLRKQMIKAFDWREK